MLSAGYKAIAMMVKKLQTIWRRLTRTVHGTEEERSGKIIVAIWAPIKQYRGIDEQKRWRTESSCDHLHFIKSGDRVVGSIVKRIKEGVVVWTVEIVWAGPGDDLTGQFTDYAQATGFVQGVEETFGAFRTIFRYN
jgi:hypothetical protein